MKLAMESQGRNSNMSLELKQTDHGGMLLTSLLFLVFSASFLIPPRSTHLRVVLPTVGRACLHQLVINKMHHNIPTSRQFFKLSSLFPGGSGLCQVGC